MSSFLEMPSISVTLELSGCRYLLPARKYFSSLLFRGLNSYSVVNKKERRHLNLLGSNIPHFRSPFVFLVACMRKQGIEKSFARLSFVNQNFSFILYPLNCFCQGSGTLLLKPVDTFLSEFYLISQKHSTKVTFLFEMFFSIGSYNSSLSQFSSSQKLQHFHFLASKTIASVFTSLTPTHLLGIFLPLTAFEILS